MSDLDGFSSDVDFESDESDAEVYVEMTQGAVGSIRPYMFEPQRSESEPDSDDQAIDSEDEEGNARLQGFW